MTDRKLSDDILQDISAFLDGECSTAKQCSVMKIISEDEDAKKAFDDMLALRDACRNVLSDRKEAKSGLWDQVACELRDIEFENKSPSPFGLDELASGSISPFRVQAPALATAAGIFLLVLMGFVVDFDHVTLVSLVDSLKIK